MKKFIKLLLLAVLYAGCKHPSDGVHTDAGWCDPNIASVCKALGGTHTCTWDGTHPCVLCWPKQQDTCMLDGVYSGTIINQDPGVDHWPYICVNDCNECAQDPREVALGITCSADDFPDGGVQ